jgi:hypothetical protein
VSCININIIFTTASPGGLQRVAIEEGKFLQRIGHNVKLISIIRPMNHHLGRFEVQHFEPTRPFGDGISNRFNTSTILPSEERGSPRPARAGGNLVGRGIANPMSERTRGFEMLLWGGTSIPLPALFSFVIFLNFLDSLVRIQVSMTQIKLSLPKYV